MTYLGSHLEILDRFRSQFLWIEDLFDIKLFTSLCLICGPFTPLEKCHGLRRGLVQSTRSVGAESDMNDSDSKFSSKLHTLRKKRPYSELLWSVFSRIRSEYREILRISSYSVWMRENTDQSNSEYGHFSRSNMILRFSEFSNKTSKYFVAKFSDTVHFVLRFELLFLQTLTVKCLWWNQFLIRLLTLNTNFQKNYRERKHSWVSVNLQSTCSENLPQKLFS